MRLSTICDSLANAGSSDQIGCSAFAQLNRISAQAWREVVQEKDDKSWSSNALSDHLKFLLAYLIEQDKAAKENNTGM